MLGEGHIRIYGTLQVGHTTHEGHQRLQCWPFPYKRTWSSLARPGVERSVLSLDNVWNGRLKLLFTLSVHIDGQAEPSIVLECAYVSFCYEIKLEPSDMQ